MMINSIGDEGPIWSLFVIVRAIVRANKSKVAKTDEDRVDAVMNALLARAPKEGRKSLDDDHLLEMIAFDYSLLEAGEVARAKDLTSIIRRLIRFHPSTRHQSLAVQNSTTRRLLRKFKQNQVDLLEQHSFTGKHDKAAQLQSLQIIFAEFRKLGVELDDSFLPAIYRNKT